MDPKLEKLQFLGVYGIIKETMKLIYQWRKIFSQITLFFILPSYLITFANSAFYIFFLPETKFPNPISSQNVYFLIFNIVSTILTTVFSLYATATVVYVVSCVYAASDVSFKHVIGIVPKVWKPLLVTFLSYYLALFALNFVAILVLLLIAFSIHGPNNALSFENQNLAILFIFMIIFFVGTWYLTLIWKLSNVVAVLEGLYGFKAMAKSKGLVKGKVRMVGKLVMVLGLPLGVVQYVYFRLVMESASIGTMGKIVLVIIWILLFSLFFLVTLVAETVLYFVCKSDYHEIVDKLSLSDHLQIHLLADNDDPLKVDDHVRIEKLQVV